MIKTINTDNIPIQFYDAGKGKALVFLHGHLESQEIWSGFTASFESQYRVIRINLPGHGASGVFGEISGMEIMAGAVKSVLDYLDLEKSIIFGHSMGGYTALAALELYPEIFSALSLVHSHAKNDSEEVKKKRNREISIIEKGQKRLLVNQNIPNMYADVNLAKFEDAVCNSKRIAHELSDEGVIAAIKGMRDRPDRSEVLKNAGIPCLNIIGKMDNYIDFEAVSMKTEMPAGSSLLILENSGHMGFVEEADKTREGIHQFLNSIG